MTTYRIETLSGSGLPTVEDEPGPDDGSADALDTIRSCRRASARSWADAADGAEIEARSACESAADSCDEEYAHAIGLLSRQDSADWLSAARTALEAARDLESEWGDASDAIEALEALDEIG
jgi:hypothetical protein